MAESYAAKYIGIHLMLRVMRGISNGCLISVCGNIHEGMFMLSVVIIPGHFYTVGDFVLFCSTASINADVDEDIISETKCVINILLLFCLPEFRWTVCHLVINYS